MPGVTVDIVGADGIRIGVTDDEADEYEPAPAAFTAATRNTYAVPLVSPVTVVARAVESARTNVVQLLPAFDEY